MNSSKQDIQRQLRESQQNISSLVFCNNKRLISRKASPTPRNKSERSAIPDTHIQNGLSSRGRTNGKHFIDKNFLPQKNMLRPLSKLFKSVWQKIDWKYASEFMELECTSKPEVEVFRSVNISQTISPLSYFHDALKLLCLQPKLLQNLVEFVPDKNGLGSHFKVKINSLGQWKTLKLDPYFPVVNFEDGSFRYFLSPPSKDKANQNYKPKMWDIWPMLLLKAYAKHHGGYHRLLMGRTTDVLRDLTGYPVDNYKLKYLKSTEQMNQLWSKLTQGLEKGNLMASKFKLDNSKGNKEYHSLVMDLIEVTQIVKTENGSTEATQMKFVLIETPTFYVSEIRDEYCEKLTKYDADIRMLIQSADQLNTHTGKANNFGTVEDSEQSNGEFANSQRVQDKIQLRSFSNISTKNCGNYESMIWVPFEQVFLTQHSNLIVVRSGNQGLNSGRNLVYSSIPLPEQPKNINRYLLKLVIPEDKVKKKLLKNPNFLNFRNNLKAVMELNSNSFKNQHSISFSYSKNVNFYQKLSTKQDLNQHQQEDQLEQLSFLSDFQTAISTRRQRNYTISICQKSKLSFPAQKFEYSNLHVLVLKLNSKSVEFVATKSSKSRFIQLDFSVDLDQGDYMVMVEQEREYNKNDPDYDYRKICKLGASLHSQDFHGCKNASLLENIESVSSYSTELVNKLANEQDQMSLNHFLGRISKQIIYQGSKSIMAQFISLQDNVAEKYYDFLLHQFSMSQALISQKLGFSQETGIEGKFSIPVKIDGEKHKLKVFVLNSYNMYSYILVNQNHFGLKFHLNFEKKHDEEVLGARGQVKNKFVYSLHPNELEVFIFRKTRILVEEQYRQKGTKVPTDGKMMKIWTSKAERIISNEKMIDEYPDSKHLPSKHLGHSERPPQKHSIEKKEKEEVSHQKHQVGYSYSKKSTPQQPIPSITPQRTTKQHIEVNQQLENLNPMSMLSSAQTAVQGSKIPREKSCNFIRAVNQPEKHREEVPSSVKKNNNYTHYNAMRQGSPTSSTGSRSYRFLNNKLQPGYNPLEKVSNSPSSQPHNAYGREYSTSKKGSHSQIKYLDAKISTIGPKRLEYSTRKAPLNTENQIPYSQGKLNFQNIQIVPQSEQLSQSPSYANSVSQTTAKKLRQINTSPRKMTPPQSKIKNILPNILVPLTQNVNQPGKVRSLTPAPGTGGSSISLQNTKCRNSSQKSVITINGFVRNSFNNSQRKNKNFIKIKHRESLYEGSQHQSEPPHEQPFNGMKRTNTAEFGTPLTLSNIRNSQKSNNLNETARVQRISYTTNRANSSGHSNQASPVRAFNKDISSSKLGTNRSRKSCKSSKSGAFSDILLNSSQISIHSRKGTFRRSQLSLRRNNQFPLGNGSQTASNSFRKLDSDRRQSSPVTNNLTNNRNEQHWRPPLQRINLTLNNHQKKLQETKENILSKIIDKENIKVNGVDVNKLKINSILNLSSRNSPTRSASRLLQTSPGYNHKNLLKRGVLSLKKRITEKNVSKFLMNDPFQNKVSSRLSSRKGRMRINKKKSSSKPNSRVNSPLSNKSEAGFNNVSQSIKSLSRIRNSRPRNRNRGLMNGKVGAIRSEYDAFFQYGEVRALT